MAVSAKVRRYDKGEKRFKHVGKGAEATVDAGRPKKVVGKCPNNVPDSVKMSVLTTAIAELPEERELPFPSRMFATYQGVIYDCRTTLPEDSYHAFPYQGDMLRSLKDRLALGDDAQKHPKEFASWVKKHIQVLG